MVGATVVKCQYSIVTLQKICIYLEFHLLNSEKVDEFAAFYVVRLGKEKIDNHVD